MKKIIVAFAGVAGFALSMNASAAAIGGQPLGGPTTIDTTACALLSEGIIINLSKNVSGGYACNTGTNVIAVAACHPNGKKDATGLLNNIYYGSSGGGSVVSDAPAATCDAGGTAAQAVADDKAAIAAPTAPAS
jgi:hypothetical protein